MEKFTVQGKETQELKEKKRIRIITFKPFLFSATGLLEILDNLLVS